MVHCWGDNHVPGCDCDIKQDELFAASHSKRMAIVNAWENFEIPYAGILIFDQWLNGFILKDLNQYALNKLGMNKSFVVGREAREVWPGMDSSGPWGELMREVLITGEPYHIPRRFYSDFQFQGYVESYLNKWDDSHILSIYRVLKNEPVLYTGTDTEKIIIPK